VQVYYLQKGLSPFQVGIIKAVMPIMNFFSQPLWGFTAGTLIEAQYSYFILESLVLESLINPLPLLFFQLTQLLSFNLLHFCRQLE
jgi:hypothetical protein